MGLTSTLFTGLSGLVVNQTDLNVVGNNIANANTTAFKSSTVEFSPQFYVTDNAGAPANGNFGGSNPSQEGLGAQVASITQNFSPGALQATGVQSNLALDGNGFFVVNNSTSGQLYTRDGNFSLNSANQLVDSAGDFVQGYGVNSSFQLVPGTLTNITIPEGELTVAQATQNATISGNLDSGGAMAGGVTVLTTGALEDSSGSGPTVTTGSLLTNLDNAGGTVALFAVGDVLTASGTQGGRALGTQTFQVQSTSTVADLQTFLTDSLGIDTTATNPTGQPAPGVSIVADPSGPGQDLAISGNIGSANALTFSLSDSSGAPMPTFTAPPTFGGITSPAASGESAYTPILAYDSLGNSVTLNVTTTLVSQGVSGTTWQYFVTSPQNEGGNPVLGHGTLTFGTDGSLTSVTGNTLTLNRTGTGADPSQQITLNFGQVQSLATPSQPSTLIGDADGFASGTLNNYSIGTDGIITGSFNNGQTQTLGQVAVANFNNPDGLVDQGGNLYAAGGASGTAIITTPGAQGTGVVRAGELELSNVDLSQEFINLIIASTGYSASSRVISTSDQLLTDLLNSQR